VGFVVGLISIPGAIVRLLGGVVVSWGFGHGRCLRKYVFQQCSNLNSTRICSPGKHLPPDIPSRALSMSL
jgi:hypothetical protein